MSYRILSNLDARLVVKSKTIIDFKVIFRKTVITFLLLSCFVATFGQDRLWGLTTNAGPGGKGTVFSLQTTGGDYKNQKVYSNLISNPRGTLIKATDGNFYGMSTKGGKFNLGCIFKMTPAGAITILRHLNGPDGVLPEGSLVEAFDKNFYGMTNNGGANNGGTIFRITPTGTFTILYSFPTNSNAAYRPRGSLILSKVNGYLYGVYASRLFRISVAGVYQDIAQDISGRYHLNLTEDETSGKLFVFAVDYHLGTYAMLYSYDLKNSHADAQAGLGSGGNYTAVDNALYASFVKAPDGFLYCARYSEGANGAGYIGKKDNALGITNVASFNFTTTGGYPIGNLVAGNDGYLYGTTSTGGNFGQGTIFKYSLSAKTITVIRHLKSLSDGSKSYSNLVLHSDGYLYGMTSEGGNLISSTSVGAGYGTIFKINKTGSSFVVLARLPDKSVGMEPRNSLHLGKDGNYYGSTEKGGTYGVGTIFKITPAGVWTLLQSLAPNTTGANPKDGPIMASDGNLYGATFNGGANGVGTIYKLTSAGVLTVLYTFNGTQGANPQARLIQAADGFLYGTTTLGGTNNQGTIFKISLAGVHTVIRHLSSTSDGASPEGALLEPYAGALFGTTTAGGLNGNGTVFRLEGTAYRVIRHLKIADGRVPSGSLIQASNGVLYGTTNAGGANGHGTIIRITISTSVFQVAYNFQGGTLGGKPYGALVEGPGQQLYGTLSAGGASGGGAIFKFTLGGAFNIIKNLDPNIGTVPKGNLLYIKSAAAAAFVDNEDAEELIDQNKSVYPNPAKSTIMIPVSGSKADFSIEILDASGVVVTRSPKLKFLSSQMIEIDVSSLAKGVYVLNVRNKSGSSVHRFVKQ